MPLTAHRLLAVLLVSAATSSSNGRSARCVSADKDAIFIHLFGWYRTSVGAFVLAVKIKNENRRVTHDCDTATVNSVDQ
jgi:hypothetical protein